MENNRICKGLCQLNDLYKKIEELTKQVTTFTKRQLKANEKKFKAFDDNTSYMEYVNLETTELLYKNMMDSLQPIPSPHLWVKNPEEYLRLFDKRINHIQLHLGKIITHKINTTNQTGN